VPRTQILLQFALLHQGSSKRCALPLSGPPKRKFGGLLWASVPLKAEGWPDFGLEFRSWAANESERWRGLLPPKAEQKSPIVSEFRFPNNAFYNVAYSLRARSLTSRGTSQRFLAGRCQLTRQACTYLSLPNQADIKRSNLSSAILQQSIKVLLREGCSSLGLSFSSNSPTVMLSGPQLSTVLRHCVRQSTRIVCMHTASHCVANRAQRFDCVA
jgi:hypothetical protein